MMKILNPPRRDMYVSYKEYERAIMEYERMVQIFSKKKIDTLIKSLNHMKSCTTDPLMITLINNLLHYLQSE